MYNKIKHKLKEGQVVLGSFLATSSPDVAEIMTLAGFDFLVIDGEHGPTGVSTTANMIRAIESRGGTAITRISDNNPTSILKTLDIGSYGIHVPQVHTKAEAEKMVKAAKYFPLGNRGAAYPRSSSYALTDTNKYFALANEETMIIPHIESIEAVNNLQEIIDVEGIDVFFLGPIDLSQSLGVSGQFDHPLMLEAIDRVLEITNKKGVPAGILATTVEDVERRIKQGFKYITYATDSLLLGRTATNDIKAIRKNIK